MTRSIIDRALGALTKEQLLLLPNLDLDYSKSSHQVFFLFNGIDNLLQQRRQSGYAYLGNAPTEGAVKILTTKLRSVATRQKLRRDRLAIGLQVDRPLFDHLQRRALPKGMNPLAILTSLHLKLAHKNTVNETSVTVQDLDGLGIDLVIENGIIQSSFAMDSSVAWRRNHLVIKNMALPDIYRASIKGLEVRKVADHPALDGMTVKTVVQSGGKTPVLTLYVDQGYVPLAA